MIYAKKFNIDNKNYEVFGHIDPTSYKIYVNGNLEVDSNESSDYLRKYRLIIDSVRPKGLCLVIGSFSKGLAEIIKGEDVQVHLCDPFYNELKELYDLIDFYPEKSYVTVGSNNPDELYFEGMHWYYIFVDLIDGYDYKFLRKISRSLHPNGRLVIYSPNSQDIVSILNNKFEVTSEIRITKFFEQKDPLLIQSWKYVKSSIEELP